MAHRRYSVNARHHFLSRQSSTVLYSCYSLYIHCKNILFRLLSPTLIANHLWWEGNAFEERTSMLTSQRCKLPGLLKVYFCSKSHPSLPCPMLSVGQEQMVLSCTSSLSPNFYMQEIILHLFLVNHILYACQTVIIILYSE